MPQQCCFWGKVVVLGWVMALIINSFPASLPQIQAQTIDLFFSEYIEGSSNNKALEIFNNPAPHRPGHGQISGAVLFQWQCPAGNHYPVNRFTAPWSGICAGR